MTMALAPLMCLLFLCSCSSFAAVYHVRSSGEVIQMNPVVPLPGSLSSSVNQFSLSLFNKLSQENGQANVFVSPFSVSTALSMLLLGARTTSADELMKGLAFDKIDTSNGKTIHQLFSELLDTSVRNGTSVSLSNYLLVRKDESDNPVLQKYKSDVKSLYDAQVDDVNFDTEGEQIKTTVNDWVKSKTKGLIKSIIDSPPDPGTTAVGLNAIYFKGEWVQKFSSPNTQKMKFWNKGVTEKESDFMVKTGKHFPYKDVTISGQKVQLLEMEYTNDSMSMVILLPESKDGLSKVLASDGFATEAGAVISNLHNGFGYRELNLYIPKFKLETDYSLKDTLSGMGIRKIFTSEADLSGINGQTNLQVTKIKHKAVVKVDEDGTEAAAVTMFDVYPMSAIYPYVPPVDFKADRPFLFLIRNRASGLIYFIGKVEEL